MPSQTDGDRCESLFFFRSYVMFVVTFTEIHEIRNLLREATNIRFPSTMNQMQLKTKGKVKTNISVYTRKCIQENT